MEDLNSRLFLKGVGLIEKQNRGGLAESHSLKPENIR